MPLSGLLLFILFFSMMGFATRAVALRKPSIPLFPTPMQSPYNHLFFASRFAEAGLRARRIAGYSAVGVLIIVAVACYRGTL